MCFVFGTICTDGFVDAVAALTAELSINMIDNVIRAANNNTDSFFIDSPLISKFSKFLTSDPSIAGGRSRE